MPSSNYNCDSYKKYYYKSPKNANDIFAMSIKVKNYLKKNEKNLY